MQRQIKFRAWQDGEMVYPTGALSNIHRFFRVIRENAIKMQYTGLKDKLGEEIYEGDIVKDEYGRIWQIVWEEYRAGFYYQLIENPKKKFDGRIGSITTSCQKYLMEKVEVIGNVYLTPQLLK
jgi:uncharacterized phage protein (TIGR01671 family)